MKIKFLIAAMLLTACARNKEDIGKIVYDYHLSCLKTETNLGTGFSSKGSIVLTTNETCVASTCVYRKLKLTKYSYDVISEDSASMDECLKWKKSGHDL